MKVAYIRVSSIEQNDLYQRELLSDCEKVFAEKRSGKNAAERPQLKAMLDFVREGDTLKVVSISRLARNTKDLLNIIDTLNEKQVNFVSLNENIDTSTASGKFMLTVFGAMYQMEREYLLEKQRLGIKLAKEANKYKGKPKIVIDEHYMRRECEIWRRGEQTARETMKHLNLKPNTFYRRVRELNL